MSKHPAGSFPSPSPLQKTRAACLLACLLQWQQCQTGGKNRRRRDDDDDDV